ncbi:MAG: RNB domain-containing ribonuclease [Desulfovibrionales bacterium]|nr:RNB domain-containing ribonuclease [Desulfovibrionales bacterium]
MSTSISLQPGCIIEFLQDNQPVSAWILDVQTPRVRVFTTGQRELKLPMSRILPWTGPQEASNASRQDMLDLLRTHHARRERLAEDIDALEIWELAQGELDQAEISWFASLVFDEPNPDHLAAVGRKLLQTKTHFRFAPPCFEIYPQDVVERRQEELRKAQERERLIGVGQMFIRDLWDSFCKRKKPSVVLDQEQTRRLTDLIMTRLTNPDDRDSEGLWKTMTMGLPEDPHLPLLLAQTWGIVPPHYNFYLARAQYDWEPEWAQPYAEAVASIQERVQARQEPGLTSIVTIDSATTKDIDDGFSLIRHDQGFTLHLALACPCLEWDFESDLGKTVQQRFASLYLPEGTSHMLPEVLGTQFFSLTAGQNHPALVLTFELDAQGLVQTLTPHIAWVQVHGNLTYTGVEEAIAAGSSALLQDAYELAALLRTERIRNHAVIMEQPDPHIVVSGDPHAPRLSIELYPHTPAAQMIVSEFMILANTNIASWCLEHNVPLLFRTQNITLSAESAGVWNEPTDIYRIINTMGPSILECEPKRHATIGAKAYASITSPLRRYSDFINVSQIVSNLTGQGHMLSKEELQTLLPQLSSRAEQVNQVQRMRPRYWKYEYFRQNHKSQRWSGIIVDPGSTLVTIALPDMQVFLKAPRKIFGDKVRLGQRFSIRMGKVDPLNFEIKIVEAWEEE